MLFLNIVMYLIAYYVSIFLKTSKETRRTYYAEVTQNGTLAIVVASTFFDNPAYLIPAAIYSLIMYITIIPFIFYLRRN